MQFQFFQNQLSSLYSPILSLLKNKMQRTLNYQVNKLIPSSFFYFKLTTRKFSVFSATNTFCVRIAFITRFFVIYIFIFIRHLSIICQSFNIRQSNIRQGHCLLGVKNIDSTHHCNSSYKSHLNKFLVHKIFILFVYYFGNDIQVGTKCLKRLFQKRLNVLIKTLRRFVLNSRHFCPSVFSLVVCCGNIYIVPLFSLKEPNISQKNPSMSTYHIKIPLS